jgi:hypothetical protein
MIMLQILGILALIVVGWAGIILVVGVIMEAGGGIGGGKRQEGGMRIDRRRPVD